MERFLIFFSFVFCSIQAADYMEIDQPEPVLRVNRVELANGCFLYTLSIKDGRRDLGKLQFKFYDTEKKPKSAEIDYIIIPEGVRNEGNGDRLLNAALDIMKWQLACKEVKTSIGVDNKPSLRLFEKNGFQGEEGRVPHALDGESIRMKKQL